MKIKKSLFIILVLIFIHLILAENTLVLQQGVNGYTGCEDTYLHFFSQDSSTIDVNHANDSDIFIKD